MAAKNPLKPNTTYRCITSLRPQWVKSGQIITTNAEGTFIDNCGGEIEGLYQTWEEATVTPKITGTNPDTVITDDVVNRPAHYACFEIEPLTFIMRNGLSFWQGNPIKYICRAGKKLYPGQDAVQSAITDLEKARRMLEMRIKQLRGDTSDCL